MNLITHNKGEKAEVLDKFEDILACTLGILSKIRRSHDLCLDRWGPSAILGNNAVKDAFTSVHDRGAKIRLITEITDLNLCYCKEYMKFAEVRHLDKVKGNFSVSDTKWYTVSGDSEKDMPPLRLIYSTVKEIAEQHQYFFETLWTKAVPVEQRIGEIEGNAVAERAEIIYGEENSVNLLLQVMARTKKEALACGSSVTPTLCMTVEAIKEKIIEAKARGVKPRQITEITKQNLPYCKEFMKFVELRHMSNVQGNLVVTDNNEYFAAASVNSSSVPQAVYSNAKTLIEQQRLFFENLWSKSIPAEQRIREIEEGIESINLEILSSNQESGARGLKMVENARQEVLVLFPAANVLNAALDLNMLDNCDKLAKQGVAVKILVQTYGDSPSAVESARKKMEPSIELRTFHNYEMKESEAIKMAILVADSKEVIVWNMLDMNTNDLYQMAGNAIYSSNTSVVSSYHAIFKTLWKQVEMYEQIRMHDQLQEEFINIAAHELRTPIQPILGMADLKESEFEDGKQESMITREELGIIVRNAKRLERLSSDILELARIESSTLHLNIQQFTLNDVILPLVQDARSQTGNNDEVEIHYSLVNIAVIADRERLVEVIWNLLDNALKFTDKGIISIKARKDDSQISITVKDSGRGIDAEVIPRLFTKFVTKSNHGTGLGLYLSKSIIEAHGGKIWAENNKDGKGATFNFTLPLSNAGLQHSI